MTETSAPEATLYLADQIVTGSSSTPSARALLVRDGRIAYVGSEQNARALAGDATVVDGLGAIVPGFVDGHGHVVGTGESLQKAYLRTASDLAEIRARLVEWADEFPDAPQVVGIGFQLTAIPGGRPTREMLDEVFPDRPVYLDSFDLHSCWLNTRALEEIGIDASTPDPIGGEIVRDPATGEATGHLLETAVVEYVWPVLRDNVPAGTRYDQLIRAVQAYNAAGVTTVVDMGLDATALAAMVQAEDAGELTTRIVGHWIIWRTGDPATEASQVAHAAEIAARHRSEWLRVAGIKIVVDGVIDTCTAALKRPYADGSNAEPIWDADSLNAVVAAADAAGLQVAMHAIGDRSVAMAVDAIEYASTLNGTSGRRHRIEHLEYADPVDIARLAPLGITASMQPVHCDPAIIDNWLRVLGDSRADDGFAWPWMLSAGATLAFGTDAPTAPFEPLSNLYVASTRRSAIDASLPPHRADFALPRETAFLSATRESAWACGAESLVGTLEEGKAADFVVLDESPLTVEAERLLQVQVLGTFVAGRQVAGTPLVDQQPQQSVGGTFAERV